MRLGIKTEQRNAENVSARSAIYPNLFAGRQLQILQLGSARVAEFSQRIQGTVLHGGSDLSQISVRLEVSLDNTADDGFAARNHGLR